MSLPAFVPEVSREEVRLRYFLNGGLIGLGYWRDGMQIRGGGDRP